jgi:hypothetical protein
MADRGYRVRPQGNILRALEQEAFRAGVSPRTKESIDWFRRRAASIRRINRGELMKQEEILLKNRTIVGSMFMYFYDPKYKNDDNVLPYYDAFPLTIIVGPAKGGFYGMNMHYLPPLLRGQFLYQLIETQTDKSFDPTMKFKVTYELLKNAENLSAFKPCFKHYLKGHVRSRFAMVQPPEFELVTFLPMADWQKASAQQVYRDSRRIIRGR